MTFSKRTKMSNTRAWIEAMRLRTLPVSTAGVLAAVAVAWHLAVVRPLPAAICLLFAILCQTASNFANEYYDYTAGIDRRGRSGPRRGVTEGDISPRAMKTATFVLLFFAMLLGLWLIYWGGAWLVAVGVLIFLGALAYSAGPYPLSRHALGEVAVVFFFGIIPVNFTFYLASGQWQWQAAAISAAIGLMAANVLIVNNYRDADEDMAVGKRTLANVLGRPRARLLYLGNGIVAAGAAVAAVGTYNMMWVAPVIYIPAHLVLWTRLNLRQGDNAAKINPLLGATAMLMLIFALLLFL